MPKPEAKRRMSRGDCHLCGQQFSKNTIARHMDKCWAELTTKEKRDKRSLQPTPFFRLAVEGRDAPDYWLHLDVRADATLEDLDDFLRQTWLECCGHLSAFAINEVRYSWLPPGGFENGGFFDDAFGDLDEAFGRPRKRRMDITLAQTISPGLTFSHEYDFGSTTELKIRVLSEHEEPTRRKQIRVLARNEPPEIPCDKCGQPAEWLGYDQKGKYREVCSACGGEGVEEQFLPAVNSPRAGVCGYTG